MTLQRDVLIKAIHAQARNDKDIVFLSADFGAEALDAFRAELPDQFIHCGISEQHMLDMAIGLALAGKLPFTYCMGPFVLRAYEQAKQAAIMDLPITMIGAGIGLGYADSGPTHYATEDLAAMRALNDIEILTPADNATTAAIADLCFEDPMLRYIRLDREMLPPVHDAIDDETMIRGFHHWPGEDNCIVSSGYMLHRALAANGDLGFGVIDLFRIKPLDRDALLRALDRYDGVVTVEEQCLDGGFGSAVLEAMDEAPLPTYRMGLPERYYFENGGRAFLLDEFALSAASIREAAQRL